MGVDIKTERLKEIKWKKKLIMDGIEIVMHVIANQVSISEKKMYTQYLKQSIIM